MQQQQQQQQQGQRPGRNDYKDPQKVQQAFYHFDRDGQGRIPTDELIGLMHNNGKRMRQEELDEFRREADPQNTGYVDYQNFIQRLMVGIK